MIYFVPSIFGLLTIILCFFSCNNFQDQNLKKVEQGKMSIAHYNEHSYIVWSINMGGGLVHDPDCKCGKGK